MNARSLIRLAAGVAVAFLTSRAQASITLELGNPDYAACGWVSINGYAAAAPDAITNLVWNWGDGTTDESWFPATHQYPTNGDYAVAVSAYADTGGSKTVTCSVVITSVCTNIVLQVSEPDYAACGQISINGYLAASPGTITNLVWNWGDGTTEESWFPGTHAYSWNGVFTVRVTAYSDLDESRTVTEPVTVTTVTSACGAPQLSITLTNSNRLAVSWLASAEGWELEATNLPGVVAPAIAKSSARPKAIKRHRRFPFPALQAPQAKEGWEPLLRPLEPTPASG
jgi:hypothetical protein